jgi:hypothetical protein
MARTRLFQCGACGVREERYCNARRCRACGARLGLALTQPSAEERMRRLLAQVVLPYLARERDHWLDLHFHPSLVLSAYPLAWRQVADQLADRVIAILNDRPDPGYTDLVTHDVWMPLSQAAPGSLVEDRAGFRAVVSEYHHPNAAPVCVLLDTGEYANPLLWTNATDVRIIQTPRGGP